VNNFIRTIQDDLISRFMYCHISREGAIQMARTLEHWEQHHGLVWVTKRLKLMKSYLLGGFTDPSLKLDKNNQHFHGCFRNVSRLFFLGTRRGKVDAIRCLSIYGLFKQSVIDEAFFVDFKNKVEQITPYTLRGCYIEYPEMGNFINSFDSRYPLGNTRAPLFSGKTDLESNIPPEEHIRTTCCFPNLIRKHHRFFSELIPISRKAFYDDLYHQKNYSGDIVGNVVALNKDRGMKVRFIANPFRVIQLALSRLKRNTEMLLKSLPESAVYDQAGGMDWVVNQIHSGRKVSSIDLSSCTDFLPLEYQLDMLYSIFPSLNEDITIFSEVSRSLWRTKFNQISWKTGQPLGTGPSFSTFTLFHIYLVRAIGGHEGNFRVIGDDIVISNPSVTARYLKVMERLQVDISVQKSVFNKDIAEFAGRILDKDGILSVYKASPLDFVNDPLGYIRQYGPRAYKSLPISHREMIKFIGALPVFGYNYIQKRELLAIPDDAIYYLYSSRLPIIPNRVIPHSGAQYKSGSTSGIPPMFLKHVGIPGIGHIISNDLNSRYTSSFNCFSKDHYGLGVWKVCLHEDPIVIDHINDNIKDTPEGEVTDLVKQAHTKHRSVSEIPIFKKDQAKPLSFVKKIWKYLKSFN